MHKYLDEFLKSLNLILAENPGASLHDIKSAIELDGPISATVTLLGYLGEVDRVYDGKRRSTPRGSRGIWLMLRR
jgi:uncharacterized protein YvpB